MNMSLGGYLDHLAFSFLLRFPQNAKKVARYDFKKNSQRLNGTREMKLIILMNNNINRSICS